jgi:hypothetical protein
LKKGGRIDKPDHRGELKARLDESELSNAPRITNTARFNKQCSRRWIERKHTIQGLHEPIRKRAAYAPVLELQGVSVAGADE